MSSKLISIVSGATTASTGPIVSVLNEDTRASTYQATVSGTGAIAATVTIEVSNDNIGWLSDAYATLVLSGSTVVTAGFISSASWAYVRARVSSISGTLATVYVTATVGA